MATSAGGLPTTDPPPDPPPPPPPTKFTPPATSSSQPLSPPTTAIAATTSSSQKFPIVSNNFINPTKSSLTGRLGLSAPISGQHPPQPNLNKSALNYSQVVQGEKLGPILEDFSFVTKKQPPVNGMPSFMLALQEWKAAAKPFINSLIMKFSNGRPSFDEVRNHVHGWRLSKNPIVGNIDGRHVLLFINNNEDTQLALARSNRQVANSLYRLFHWSQDFEPKKESSMAAVWTRLHYLPLPCLHESIIKGICNSIGKHIKTDPKSLSLENPSMVRACIEMDLKDPLPEYVWIGTTKENGINQRITYEGNVKYCLFCELHGHLEDECRKKLKIQSRPAVVAQSAKPTEITTVKINSKHQDQRDWNLVKNRKKSMVECSREENDTQILFAPPPAPAPVASMAEQPGKNASDSEEFEEDTLANKRTGSAGREGDCRSQPGSRGRGRPGARGRGHHMASTNGGRPLTSGDIVSLPCTQDIDLNNTLDPSQPHNMNTLLVSGRHTHNLNTHSANLQQPNPLPLADHDTMSSTHVLDLNTTLATPHIQINDSLILSGRQTHIPTTSHSATCPQPNPLTKSEMGNRSSTQVLELNNTLSTTHKARATFSFPPASVQQPETSSASAMRAECLALAHGPSSVPLPADQGSLSISSIPSNKKNKESKKIVRTKKLFFPLNSNNQKSKNAQAILLGLAQTEENDSFNFFPEEENLSQDTGRDLTFSLHTNQLECPFGVMTANEDGVLNPAPKIIKKKTSTRSRSITRSDRSKETEEVQDGLDMPIFEPHSDGSASQNTEDLLPDFTLVRSKSGKKKSKKTKG